MHLTGAINLSGVQKFLIYSLEDSDGSERETTEINRGAALSWKGQTCDGNDKLYGAFETTSPNEYSAFKIKFNGNANDAQEWVVNFDLGAGAIDMSGFYGNKAYYIVTKYGAGTASDY